MQLMDRSKALSITPFLRLGFRPFFFFGVLLAMLAIPLWVMALTGHIESWQPVGGWLAWHRHELLFGFAGAIVAGFLLTAVQTWTGVPGLSGKLLLGLTVVWLLARFSWLLGLPLGWVILFNGLFMPLVALQMARSVWPVRQVRNYPLVVVLVVLSLLEFLVLYGVASGDDALQRQGVLGGVWAVGALMSIIGGRVIPFFTQRGLLRMQQVAPVSWLEQALQLGTAVIILSFAAGWALEPNAFLGLIFIAMGVGHGVRAGRWHDPGLWKVPLLWSLHVAYLWFVIAFLAMGLWYLEWIGSLSLAVHALTVGGMSGLILAMIARVTLGHTGRMLNPPKAMVAGFVIFNVGALFRVFGVGVAYTSFLWLAAVCWVVSLLIYLVTYGPMLWRARVDGAPG